MGHREEKKLEQVRDVANAAVASLRRAEAASAVALEELSTARAASGRIAGVDTHLRFLAAQIERYEKEDEQRAAALIVARALDALDEAEGAAWRRSLLVAGLSESVATEKRLRAELEANTRSRRELLASFTASLGSVADARAAASLPTPLHETIVRNYAPSEPAETLLARLTDEAEGCGRFAAKNRPRIDALRREETELRAELEAAHRKQEEASRRAALNDETIRAERERDRVARAQEAEADRKSAIDRRAKIEELAAAHRKRTGVAGQPSNGAES